MELTTDLTTQGFHLGDVCTSDLPDYINIKKLCLKKYIDAHADVLGAWSDEIVSNDFFEKMKACFFKKLMSDDNNNHPVGFMSYDIKERSIDEISINLVEASRNKGIGALYLKHLIELSHARQIPVYLYVMESNPARHLYERFGFKVIEHLEALDHMAYFPVPAVETPLIK